MRSGLRASPPPSPSPAAPAAGEASPDVDEASLVKIPVVRELVLENERLLCEAAAYRRLALAVSRDGPTRLALEEQVKRGTLALAEADARQAISTESHASLLSRLAATEDALADAWESNERVQGCVAIAKASLEPRWEDGDGVSRRLSGLLAEKENLTPRAGVKRRAEAMGHTPPDASPMAHRKVRLSADSNGRRTQPSPSEITKDRKTLHETDLAVSPGRRRVLRHVRQNPPVGKGG